MRGACLEQKLPRRRGGTILGHLQPESHPAVGRAERFKGHAIDEKVAGGVVDLRRLIVLFFGGRILPRIRPIRSFAIVVYKIGLGQEKRFEQARGFCFAGEYEPFSHEIDALHRSLLFRDCRGRVAILDLVLPRQLQRNVELFKLRRQVDHRLHVAAENGTVSLWLCGGQCVWKTQRHTCAPKQRRLGNVEPDLCILTTAFKVALPVVQPDLLVVEDCFDGGVFYSPFPLHVFGLQVPQLARCKLSLIDIGDLDSRNRCIPIGIQSCLLIV